MFPKELRQQGHTSHESQNSNIALLVCLDHFFPPLYFGQQKQITKPQQVRHTGGAGVRGRAGGRAEARLAWVGDAYT